MTTVHEVIVHCQKQIKKDPPPEKLLHYLRRLSRLRITIDDLRETGIGKTVNQLSRLDGEVGQYAGKIVEEWKAMVETQSEENENSDSSSSSSSSSSSEDEADDSEHSDLEIDETYQSQSSPAPAPDNNNNNNHINIASDQERLGEPEGEDEEEEEANSLANRSIVSQDLECSNDENDENPSSEDDDDDSGQESGGSSHSSDNNKKVKINGHENRSRSSRAGTSYSSSDSEKGGHRDKNVVPKDQRRHRDREYANSTKISTTPVKQEVQIVQVKQEPVEGQNYSKSREKDRQSRKPERSEPDSGRHSHHHSSRHGSKEKEKKHRDRSKEKHREIIIKEERHEKRHHHNHHREESSSSHSRKHEKEKSEKRSSDYRHHDSKREREHKKEKDKHRSEDKSKKSSSSDHKSKGMSNGESSQESPRKESSNKRKKLDEPPVKEKDVKKQKLMIKLKNEEIDSTSGVNFADVLGCLDQTPKLKSSKKVSAGSGSSSSSLSASSSSKTPKKNGALESVIPTHKPIKTEKLDDQAVNTKHKSKSVPSYAPPVPSFDPPNTLPLPIQLDIDDKPYRTRYEDSLMSINNDPVHELDALSSMMSRMKDRTKVYSGHKSGYVGKVPTLAEMCIRVIQDNLDCLGYTGGVPYDILKPALEKATVKQLQQIEYFNPYLEEETDELWMFHCKRECRGEAPQELESWRELYFRCQEERQNKLKKLTSQMKKSAEAAQPVRKAKLAYVEPSARGPKFNKSKAATIKNGMKTLKVREEKGPKSSGLSYSASAGGKTSQNISVEEAAVVISADSRAATAAAPSIPRESSSSAAAKKPRKAPLMQKTLKLIKSVYRR